MVLLSANVLAASTASFYFNTSTGDDESVTLSEIIRSSVVMLKVTTDRATTCKYSDYQGTSYDNMEETFDFNFETLHKKDLIDMTDGVHKYYVRCENDEGNESGELEAIFAVSVPVTAQVVLEDGSPLGNGRTEVTLVTSKALSQTPSLSYSFDGIGYDPIPLFGSGVTWQGYLVISSSDSEKVGSFKFQGRDLEGVLGTEITSGGFFIVDTKRPETISDIDAVGYEGEIKLNWYIDDEDDVEKFNIYRSTSPNVDHSDFYESTESLSFKDTSVEKGKTYYYKVSAVDEAENEGGLSREVYATALLENVTSLTGLEARFHGLVDSFLSDVDSVIGLAEDVENGFDDKDEKERNLYSDLKLEREINGAKSELSSLRREVVNYKAQSLTRSELDGKLNSGQLKLNTIKKKIPENIIIVSEKIESGG
ncbi:MAG: hypothetical protein ABIH92_05815, partial [Nanoarchaeota archaeon]